VKRLLVAALVSAVLVGVLFSFTSLDWEVVGRSLLHLDPALAAASFGIYALSFAGRGLRLLVLLPGAGRLLHLSSIATRHIFLAVVLPARTGEASLPVMLSAECGRPLEEGVSVLALQRLLDLACVAFFLVAGVLLSGAGGDAAAVLPRAAAVLALLVAGVLLLRPACARLAALAGSTRRPLAFVGRSARHVAALGGRQLLLATATSLATWLCTYGACWLLLLSLATPDALGDVVRVSFPVSLVGTTGLHLSAVLPVSPLAGVGTWEMGWVAGYTLAGLPQDAALASAIVGHALILAFIVVLGGCAWLIRPAR
jgi:uncharacterized membrane protein YbhN (UPF0104 family)